MGYGLSTINACFAHIVFLFCTIALAHNLRAPQETPAPPTGSSPTLQNVSIAVDNAQIVYTPFLCDDITGCPGGWERTVEGGSTVISTTGPSADGSFILPQMFLRFKASALYIATSFQSNATSNVTISSEGEVAEVQVDTRVGKDIVVVNLVQDQETQVTITYVPSPEGSPDDLLVIQQILLTVTDDLPTESFLPSVNLPPSSALPTFSPTATSAIPSPENGRNRMIAQAVGITVGLGLGLTSLAIGIYIVWRRKRQTRQADVTPAMAEAPAASRPSPPAPPVPPPPAAPLQPNSRHYSWQDPQIFGSVRIPDRYQPDLSNATRRESTSYSLAVDRPSIWERLNRRSRVEDDRTSWF